MKEEGQPESSTVHQTTTDTLSAISSNLSKMHNVGSRNDIIQMGTNTSEQQHTSKGISLTDAYPEKHSGLYCRNVYISGLPAYFTPHDFREMCQQYGRIEASKLCIDGNTLPTKGYGFALFCDELCAAACIQGLNGTFLSGRRLQARYADITATPQPVGDQASVHPPIQRDAERRTNSRQQRRGGGGLYTPSQQITPMEQSLTPMIPTMPMMMPASGYQVMPASASMSPMVMSPTASSLDQSSGVSSMPVTMMPSPNQGNMLYYTPQVQPMFVPQQNVPQQYMYVPVYMPPTGQMMLSFYPTPEISDGVSEQAVSSDVAC